ncbi:ferritin [bacterium]|nr:ferritin [bacterium]
MISKELEKAFNEQITFEIYSEYIYLSMQAYCARMHLAGFTNWLDIQVKEERAHAMGLYNYVISRGGKVELGAIDAPKQDWNSVLEVFEDVLKHEQIVTSRINALADIADEVKDRAATSFLDWYISEQVEEENNASEILAKLRLIKEDANALLLLDKDLAARVFNPPVIG